MRSQIIIFYYNSAGYASDGGNMINLTDNQTKLILSMNALEKFNLAAEVHNLFYIILLMH